VVSSRRHPAGKRRTTQALIEALDRRTLLSASFTFNIIDPNNTYAQYHAELQNLLNAAGGEWASHLNVPEHDVTLNYDVAFSTEAPRKIITSTGYTLQLAVGAAKSAQLIGTDTLPGSDTGDNVYQLGTVTKLLTGNDPNGAKADAGITIYAPFLPEFYFDPQLNKRDAVIPAGDIDGYSVILQEMGHTLGFKSARNALGVLPGTTMYTYDQHVQVFGSGFYEFGTGSETYNFQTGNFDIDPSSDNAYKVYGSSVPLEAGNPSELGQGQQSDAILTNPDIGVSFFNVDPALLDDLSTDLMGGLIKPGERKTVSKLDLAILADSGVPVNLNLDTSPEGILTIDGTGNSDHIDVSLTNGTLLVRVNSSVTTYDSTQSQGITAIVVNGLAGNDYITLGPGSPAVDINGGAGNDTIIGGPKGDSLSGGGGNDLIYGGAGGDVIHGNDGKDTIYGQGGSDRVFGDGSNDYVDGGDQTDHVYGGSGNDTVVGGTGDDFLFGDSGNDLVSGAGGKDRMDGGSGADAFYGGNGNDSVDYSTRVDGIGVIASIDGNANDGYPNEGDNIFSDVENIIGTAFADRIVGSEGPNSLMGGSGDDTIDGAGGNDTLEGNAGNDVLTGSGGNDSLIGGVGNDRMVGGSGRDILLGEDGNDIFAVDDSGEVDTVDGGNGIDSGTADSVDSLTNVENPTIVGGVALPASHAHKKPESLVSTIGLTGSGSQKPTEITTTSRTL